jgi:hypothetical protein
MSALGTSVEYQATASDGVPMRLDSITAEGPAALAEALSRLLLNRLDPWHPRRLERPNPRTPHYNRRGRSAISKTKMAHPNERERKWLDVEALRAKQKAFAIRLHHKLLGRDPLHAFAQNCEKVMADWNLLKRNTALPNVASSSDLRIIHAFKAVDDVICGRQGCTLLRRLAYVQLMRLFDFVEDIIAFERETGRVARGRYYRDASVALDLYMSAQTNTLSPDDLRRELKERKRIGRSWKDLSKPSPLLVLMYSGAAESVM